METPFSVRPEITGAKITATRGRLFLIRVGTKDQLAVMADRTKPFQAAPTDSLHNLLY